MSKDYWLGLATLPAIAVAVFILWCIFEPSGRNYPCYGCNRLKAGRFLPWWLNKQWVPVRWGGERTKTRPETWLHLATHPECQRKINERAAKEAARDDATTGAKKAEVEQ